MTYTVKRTNGLNPIVIADNTIDNSTSITLVGRNWSNYGSLLDQNFLQMLENFADAVPPANPIAGQLYYNTTSRKLQVFDSILNSFKSIVSVYTDNTAPATDPQEGDLWMDTFISANPVLKCYVNNRGWVVIGPPAGAAQLTSELLSDAAGNQVPVLSMFIQNKRFAILSPNVNQTWGYPFRPVEGTPPHQKPIPGFHTVYPGFNINSQDDVSNNRFIGQATDSVALDGLLPTQFMRTDLDTYTTGTLNIINANGLVQGSSDNFHLHSDNTDTLFTSNINSARLRFQTTNVAGYTSDSLTILGNNSVYFNSDVYIANSLTVPNMLTSSLNVTSGLNVTGDVNTASNVNVLGHVQLGNLLHMVSDSVNQIWSSTASDYTALQDLHYTANSHIWEITGGTAFKIESNGRATFTANDGLDYPFVIKNSQGYDGYGASFQMFNSNQSSVNGNKTFRTNIDGNLQIINSAYTAQLFSLSDTGEFKVAGNVLTDISSLKIGGGIASHYLITDGQGNLSWNTIDPTQFAVSRWVRGRQINLFGDVTGNLSMPMDGSSDVYLSSALPVQANITAGTTYYSFKTTSKGIITDGNTIPPVSISGTASAGQVAIFTAGGVIGGSGNLTYDGTTLSVTGDISATGDLIGFATSDRNLKTNLTPIENALDKVTQLTGYTFDWNEQAKLISPNRTSREAGVMAQEVAEVLPEVVTTRENGYMAVNYDKLVPLLIQAIKELNAKLSKYEANK